MCICSCHICWGNPHCRGSCPKLCTRSHLCKGNKWGVKLQILSKPLKYFNFNVVCTVQCDATFSLKHDVGNSCFICFCFTIIVKLIITAAHSIMTISITTTSMILHDYQNFFSFIWWEILTSFQVLEALFNNVSTWNNLSCMALHAISVFDKVYKWSPEKLHKSASKEWK